MPHCGQELVCEKNGDRPGFRIPPRSVAGCKPIHRAMFPFIGQLPEDGVAWSAMGAGDKGIAVAAVLRIAVPAGIGGRGQVGLGECGFWTVGRELRG